MGTTVRELREAGSQVEASLSDGSRADARLVPLALDHYLERTTKPVRANQRDSRGRG
jgi:hypothetical protein